MSVQGDWAFRNGSIDGLCDTTAQKTTSAERSTTLPTIDECAWCPTRRLHNRNSARRAARSICYASAPSGERSCFHINTTCDATVCEAARRRSESIGPAKGNLRASGSNMVSTCCIFRCRSSGPSASQSCARAPVLKTPHRVAGSLRDLKRTMVLWSQPLCTRGDTLAYDRQAAAQRRRGTFYGSALRDTQFHHAYGNGRDCSATDVVALTPLNIYYPTHPPKSTPAERLPACPTSRSPTNEGASNECDADQTGHSWARKQY